MGNILQSVEEKRLLREQMISDPVVQFYGHRLVELHNYAPLKGIIMGDQFPTMIIDQDFQKEIDRVTAERDQYIQNNYTSKLTD